MNHQQYLQCKPLFPVFFPLFPSPFPMAGKQAKPKALMELRLFDHANGMCLGVWGSPTLCNEARGLAKQSHAGLKPEHLGSRARATQA